MTVKLLVANNKTTFPKQTKNSFQNSAIKTFTQFCKDLKCTCELTFLKTFITLKKAK
jgi:hypothetical protein